MGKACGCITLQVYTYIANSLISLTVVLTVSATIVSSVSSFISSSMSWFFWATWGLPIKDQAIAFGLSWPFGLGSVVAHAASLALLLCPRGPQETSPFVFPFSCRRLRRRLISYCKRPDGTKPKVMSAQARKLFFPLVSGPLSSKSYSVPSAQVFLSFGFCYFDGRSFLSLYACRDYPVKIKVNDQNNFS
jgi:hypothetical protein